MGFLDGSVVKNPPIMQEMRVQPLGQEDSPREGNGNPLLYSCLENPMDGGAWRATVLGYKESDTTWCLNSSSGRRVDLQCAGFRCTVE